MGKRTYILALIFILELGFLSFKSTYALFSDNATSSGNIFAAASVFPTPTPTPTPSATANIFVSNDHTCPGGAVTTDTLKGTVTFTFNDTTLDLAVTLSGATPATAYDIWVNQDPGACPLPSPTFTGVDALVTDGSGNGTKTYPGHTRVSGATKFWVSAVAGSDVFRSVATNP